MRSSILTQKRAKYLRKYMTIPERAVWAMLRRDVVGVHFRRQHAFGPFILDFYCAAAKLCVEIGGPVHEEEGRAEADARRTAWLGRQGVRVLRFTTDDVDHRPAVIVAAIRVALGLRLTPP